MNAENEKILDEFKTYIYKIKTSLTAKVYTSAVSVFLSNLINEKSVRDMNDEELKKELIEYISLQPRAYHKKFAFKYFLDFLGRGNLYYELPKISQLPRRELTKSLSFSDVKKIVDYSLDKNNLMLALITMMQYDTAHRIGAILKIKLKNISQDDDGMIFINIIEKGGRIATIYLSEKTVEVLDDFLRKEHNISLEALLKIKDKEILDKNLIEIRNRKDAYHKIWEDLKKISREILPREISTHWYRHSRILHLFQTTENGKRKYSLEDIQKITGHKSLDSLKKYLEEAGIESKELILNEPPKW